MRLAIICCIAITHLACSAQTTQAKKARAASHTSDAFIPLRPFDPGVLSLPPRFTGTNVEVLWTLLNARQITGQKSEYETQQAFQLRRQSSSTELLSPSFHRNDLLAIIIPLEADKYDAEKQELPVFIPYSKSSDENSGEPTWQWSHRYDGGKSYVGSNAFGASTVVETGGSTEYNIVATLPPWLDQQSYSSLDSDGFHMDELRQILLPMSPDDAKRMKSRLKCALIGTLATTAVSENTQHHTPTLQASFDTHAVYRNVHLTIQQFWIIDASTGTVLRRYLGTH